MTGMKQLQVLLMLGVLSTLSLAKYYKDCGPDLPCATNETRNNCCKEKWATNCVCIDYECTEACPAPPVSKKTTEKADPEPKADPGPKNVEPEPKADPGLKKVEPEPKADPEPKKVEPEPETDPWLKAKAEPEPKAGPAEEHTH